MGKRRERDKGRLERRGGGREVGEWGRRKKTKN